METIKKLFKKYESFIKFCIIGVMNTLISYGVYSLLVALGMRPSADSFSFASFFPWLGTAIANANTIGDTVGAVNSYFWNSRWTFKNDDPKAIPRFIITSIIYVIISNVLMWLAINPLALNEYLAKLIVIPIATVINFFLNKIFVFGKRKEK